MRCIRLDPGLDGCRTAHLRALTGEDEQAADSGVIALLDRLLVAAGAGSVSPGVAARLAVCDRDRLLAAVYQDLFGDRIEADAVCRGCEKSFAVQFSLTELIDAQPAQCPPGIAGPDEQGCYHLQGVTFRLPSAADLAAVARLEEAERHAALLIACVLAGYVGARRETIEAAMAVLGPTLDIDLDARCPHCDVVSSLRFDIGPFLLSSLGNERRFRLREVHCIARAYGWSYSEIMALPRTERQDLVRLIGADAAALRDLAAAE
jgi:hypothetical protein